MSTSLARQLAALQSPATIQWAPERRVSILFTKKEAAGYDRETFYNIGLDGLDELISIAPYIFGEFRHSIIFNKQAVTIERSTEDEEVNQAIDTTINHFLVALSPYFTIKASLKCLEWLVYRFHIENFNVDAVLKCILPYYDTKHFTFVIQILEVSKFKNNQTWHWLTPCVQNGLTVRKTMLYDNGNNQFISWLFQTYDDFANVHRHQGENLRVFIAFMTSTIVGIVTKINSNHSRKWDSKRIGLIILLSDRIIDCLEKCDGSTNNFVESKTLVHIQSMLYIITALLVSTIQEFPDLAEYLPAEKVLKIFQLVLLGKNRRKEAFLLMNSLANVNSVKWKFPSQKQFRIAMDEILEMSEQWDLSNLISKLLISNASNPKVLTPSKVFLVLDHVQMSPNLKSTLLRKIYFVYVKNGKLRKWAPGYLSHFESRFPTEFDLAKSKHPTFRTSVQKFKKSENLGLLVIHSDPNIRAEAVRKLISRGVSQWKEKGLTLKSPLEKESNSKLKKFKAAARKRKRNKVSLEETYCQEGLNIPSLLKARFYDDDPSVLGVLVGTKLKRLLKIFTKKTLSDGLIEVLRTKRILRKKCVKKLCSLLLKLKSGPKKLALREQIMRTLLPFLFPQTPMDFKVAKVMLTSKFAKTDAFFQQFSSNEEILETPVALCKFSYDAFTNSKNLPISGLIDNDGPQNELMNVVLSCITCKRGSMEEVASFLTATETFNISSCTEYPVTRDNFHSCVRFAEKQKKLSLELVLTNLDQQNISGTVDVAFVVYYVWRIGEHVKNRHICMQFLQKFLKKTFPKQDDEFAFWCDLIKHLSSRENLVTLTNENSKKVNDYTLIRSLQFFSAFLAHYKLASHKSSPAVSKSASQIEHRPVTRHQKTLETLSQTRITRNRAAHAETPELQDLVTNSPRKTTQTQEKVTFYVNSATARFLQVIFGQCLQHDNEWVRKWALDCLKVKISSGELEKELIDFFKHIVDYRSEVLSDPEQAKLILNNAVMKNEQFTHVKRHFMSVFLDAKTEMSVFLSYLPICKCYDSMIFSQMVPRIKHQFEEDPESDVLLSLLDCYDGTLQEEQIIQLALQYKKPAKKILSKITREVFDKFNEADQKKIFCMLVDSALSCKIPEIKLSIQRCVRKWMLDANILSHELVRCIGMERRSTCGTNTPASKRKKSLAAESKPMNDADWLSRTEVVLEFIQGKKNICSKTKLIAPLFKILKICLGLEVQAPVEYLKQLVLTALTNCCYEEDDFYVDFSRNEKAPNAEDFVNFNVESVIECLRCSRNPQTHHHALILLNYASKRFPEQVLHGVMSLFTFMGNSILRQDDTYSTQLIQQTVMTIIPTLANSSRRYMPSYSPGLVSASIYRVFASAVQDIPAHRRLPVFTSLVETLEPEQSLWQICIIIVDNALNRDKKRSNLNTDLELAVGLAWSFSPQVVLKSLEYVYGFLGAQKFYEKEITPDDFEEMKTRQDQLARAIIDFNRKESFRDVQIVVHYTLELVSKIATRFTELEDSSLQYDALLERCLSFSRLVSNQHQDKLFRLIGHRNFEIIDKINAALDPETFVRVTSLILARDDIGVKKKMLDMLNTRIFQKVEWFGPLENLIQLLPPLLTTASVDPDTEELVTLVQTAFLSLKLIARYAAPAHPNHFIPVFELSLDHTRHESLLLRASALLCMGELFNLKSLILPHLSEMTTSILQAFKKSSKLIAAQLEKEQNESNQLQDSPGKKDEKEQYSMLTANLLCNSTITSLNKMVEHLGSFLGADFLRKVLIATSSLNSVDAGTQGKIDTKRKERLKALVKSIATKIPLRTSLKPIKKAFSSVTGQPKALEFLLGLLKETLSATPKADFVMLSQNLVDAFVEDFLPFRGKMEESGESEENIVGVEDSVIECLIHGIVLKMSESQFRPYYHRLFDWTEEIVAREITFYRFSAAAAAKLKSLFVTFAGYVMNKATGALNKDPKLTNAILSFFYHIFLNDREGFVTTERFNTLAKPLVDLMESEYVIAGKVDVETLNTTLIQLAVATNDLNRWQHLIDLISTKGSHENQRVRLNVISSIQVAATELGKDFLPLLPPAVPVLAELMNDDDPVVEAQTQKMLLQLENIVGEPLQPYFSTD